MFSNKNKGQQQSRDIDDDFYSLIDYYAILGVEPTASNEANM